MKTKKQLIDFEHKGNEKHSFKLRPTLLSLCMLTFIGGYSQTGQVNLNLKNATVKELFREIEKQTSYRFSYRDIEINNKGGITISGQGKELKEVLTNELAKQQLSYTVSGNKIIVSPVKKEATSTKDKKVTGKVIDAKGEPVIGATIMEKGTTNGTITDFDGNFTLNVSDNSMLEVSYVGYQAQSIKSIFGKNLAITLKEDTELLDEVVVVGYGTQKRASVTGAVATVSSKDLTVAPVANTTNALAGRLPGLITKQQSGLPGSDGSSLSIRGFDAPLVIVDGVETNFNNIDPNEIESISVLKDASAAIYGSRAGNGVILVTTKRGQSGKPTITLNSSITFQNPMQLMKMASAGQYTEMVREAHIQSGQPESTSRFSQEQIDKYYAGDDPDYPSTDWFDYLIRDLTPMQQHNLSLRGGNDRIKYYGFFGYLDQESMIKRGGGNYVRYNIRSNIDAKILDNLNMSVDISNIIENRRFPWRDSEGANSVWQDIWNTEPIYPAELPDKDKISFANGGGTGGAHVTSNRDLSGTRDTDNNTFRMALSLKWDVKQLPGLSVKGNFILDQWRQDYKMFQYLPDMYTYNNALDVYTKVESSIETKLEQSASKGRNLTGQVSLNYDRTFAEEHKVSAMALWEIIDYYNDWFSGARTGFATNSIPYLFAGSLNNQIADGRASEMGRESFIGRLRYSYKERYLFEGTLRYDGSAKFAKDSRWGLFPSISMGWRLSEEAFIKNNTDVISNLKLRGGFSITGNDGVANFNYLTGYNYGNIYNIGGNSDKGLIATGLPNPNLTWEKMIIYNVGIDFGLFDNKLYGEGDAFYRLRDGIPGNRATSIPDIFGENLPLENLNKISTRGFEFMVGYKNQIKDFNYNISANVSWARSKWEYFDEAPSDDPDVIRLSHKTGKWVDEMYGYKSNGLFTSQEQINNIDYLYVEGSSDNSHLRPGDVILLNTNGDALLNWRDQVVIGKGTTPHWMSGLNVDLNWKGFDFNMLWQGAFGFSHQVVLERGIAKPEIMYKERWTYENNNPNAIVARLGGASSNSWASDYNIIDGDYFRLKNLAIGYSLPKDIVSKVKISNLRIYIAGTNLLTFSKLNKYCIDPEAASGSGGYYYPQMRTFTIGLNVSF